MKVLLYARRSLDRPQEIHRQWAALRRSLNSKDSVALSCSDLDSGGLAQRPEFVQVLTLLNAGEVGEIHALSLDRLARSLSEPEELQKFLDRQGVVLKLLEEDAEVQGQGGW